MARVDLVEPYAVRQARQHVRDSLMSHGEEVILLHTYHVNEDEGKHPRCSCWDDVYQQNDKYDCPRCYGSTFEGGIKHAMRAWAIFTDAQDSESTSKRGVWNPQEVTMHTEHLPDLWKRDYVVRVKGWTPDHRPTGVMGIWVMREVTNESLRTGNRLGQTSFDVIGQRADLTRLSEDTPIHRYPVVDKQFHRFDRRPR
ncbi:hypothetical protein SEA_PUPPER_110 [Gordonia phage Pupper]|uniref:Uncharacterized protein n=1 Tax=Gordonia phage Pupper TaxID=2571249 RepID=A0A4Y6EIN2_9CAUD|nr:hypothetical protein KHQ83_gp167 [Gordonia phage Pupper]QDF18596.1 hypothetical protein SEA_PUPPER_110 [Gordonia phage Pupper]QDF18828.1 hypothetical protein SEA_SCENTAE_109 [Gordonia phage SCentae]